MILQYSYPAVSSEWCDTRQTDKIVATAIHAISDSKRSAEDIWEAPTETELEHIKMAMQQYIMSGEFTAEENNEYYWGQFTIREKFTAEVDGAFEIQHSHAQTPLPYR